MPSYFVLTKYLTSTFYTPIAFVAHLTSSCIIFGVRRYAPANVRIPAVPRPTASDQRSYESVDFMKHHLRSYVYDETGAIEAFRGLNHYNGHDQRFCTPCCWGSLLEDSLVVRIDLKNAVMLLQSVLKLLTAISSPGTMGGSASVYSSILGSGGLKNDFALFFEMTKMLDEHHPFWSPWGLRQSE